MARAAGTREGASVLGSRVDAGDWGGCLDRIFGWAVAGEARYVCLRNVHSLVTARRETRFRQAVGGADLALPDGAPVAWCLRRLGFPRQRRLDGPTLMWKVCARAAAQNVPVFLLGATDRTLDRLAARLAREFPRFVLAGTLAPPFRRLDGEDDERIVREIRRSGARIVLVALGCPAQEAWMAAHRGAFPAVTIGVGAAFDFHAGTVRRAPAWMCDSGLEWLFRLAAEPRRLWRRYLVTNTLFVAYLLRDLLAPRRRRASWS